MSKRNVAVGLIRESKVPKPSTDANGSILKISFAIAEDMHQNVVAFHAANGMLNKDPDLTQGGIGSFVLIAQLWSRVLFALARLLCRDVNPITRVVRFNTKIAQINTNIDVGKPIHCRWQLLLQHDVVVIVPAECATKKNNKLVRQRHDRVLQRMPFFFRCNARVVLPHLGNDDTPVRWHQSGGDLRLATRLSTPLVL